MIRKFESLAFESATLHAYLREISSFPSLTVDHERQLAAQIRQSQDEEALSRLVQANLRLVAVYARRFRHLGVPLLDLIHEGNLGLIEAARRYDPDSAQDFQSFALWWIRQAMMHLLGETGRTAETSTAGLMAAASQGRQVEAIRAAIDYALSLSAGQELREPATSDVEDLAAHVRHRERRQPRHRKRRIALATLEAMRQPSVLRGYLN